MISVGSNIVTLAILNIFNVKKYDLDFSPWESSKVKSDSANRKLMGPTCKCSEVQPRICHRFQEISNQRIVTLICDPSRSSKVKFDGANRKHIGTFLYDFCLAQHYLTI